MLPGAVPGDASLGAGHVLLRQGRRRLDHPVRPRWLRRRRPPGDTADGAHATALVGFVANADLPVGVAPDRGILGGFFVAKNSRDTAWGDCGFFYVSSEFLEEWGAAYDVFEID